jgi:hypothetical protein
VPDRRQGAGQRVLISDDDVGLELRHRAVDRLGHEAAERHQVGVPQFPYVVLADLAQLAVGPRAGRVDGRIRPDERTKQRLRPAPGHLVPLRGQLVANGHSGPHVSHDRDDYKKESGHARIMTYIDNNDAG